MILLCDQFFFFNDTATTEIYTLPLHAALPISPAALPATSGATGVLIISAPSEQALRRNVDSFAPAVDGLEDRKSTRLNSSHQIISYALFCLKKKNHQSLKRTPV